MQLTESCIFLKGFLAVETFGIITLFPDFTALWEIVYILMAKLTGRKFSLQRIILEHKVYFKKINAKLSRFKNNFHLQKKPSRFYSIIWNAGGEYKAKLNYHQFECGHPLDFVFILLVCQSSKNRIINKLHRVGKDL